MKYFPQENIFFLVGHGSENLHDPQRYKLKKNQYAAIPLNPGEPGVSKPIYSYLDIIWKEDSNFKIEIPTGGKKIVDNLGFGSRFAARLQGSRDEKKDIRIEDFKIYRPQMGDFDKQKYWYTLPHMIYAPTAVFHRYSVEFNNHKIYKNVKYNNLNAMIIQLSGIISSTKNNIVLRENDIDDYDKAYPYLFENMSDDDIEKYLPLPSLTKYTMELFYPNNSVLNKKINQIIKDKKEDPLTYDFYCWLKALYKASVIPLNDLLLMDYCRYFEPDSPIEKYKRIKKILSSKKKLETWINDFFSLNNILDITLEFKDVYDLLEEIVKPKGPYIIVPFICRSADNATTRTKLSAKRKSRPRHTRKLKRNFWNNV